MRILSWNLNVRRCCAEQAEAVAALGADVALLQEVSAASWARLVPALRALGYEHLLTARQARPGEGEDARAPGRFTAIASRHPFAPGPAVRSPAVEFATVGTMETTAGVLHLVCVYIPLSRKGDPLLKIETQEALAQWLLGGRSPAIVAGDFNSPQHEAPDGTVKPFTPRARLREHAAELRLMGATTGCGLVDVFRAVHGYERTAASWWWKNRGRTGGYRIDHIFASPDLVPAACDYIDAWRLAGLSDHAAIYADFPAVAP